ncbi:unnamed protein product, partial [marine sediment metagenome]
NLNPQDFKDSFEKENIHQLKEMQTKTEPMTAPFILYHLSKYIGSNSIVFSDIGGVGFSTIRHFITNKNSYYVSPMGYSMGQGVSGCIGGKLACPEKHIFCITGDGAFLMHGNEVLTAVQYNLGITWIIFKEGLYNVVEINQCLAYNGELGFCTQLQNPDYFHLAKAYGVHYFEINTFKDLKIIIAQVKELNLKNESSIIIINYSHSEHLPIKPRAIEFLKDYGQTKDIKSNPYLMRALKKVIQEKV